VPAFQPVSKNRHGSKRWLRYTNFSFAAADTICLLVAAELPKAIMSFPVAFQQSASGFAPVAVLGLEAGKNLFVGPDQRWLGEYTPAPYRGYPFKLAQHPDGRRLLCVDEESGLISDGPTGELFLQADDTPAPALAEVLNFLTQIAANSEATLRACAALQEFGLLEPWPITVKKEDGTHVFNGLHRISEAAMNALPDDQFLTLRKTGALSIAYSQLISMQHIGRLAELQKRAAAVPVTTEWFAEDEILSFDNL
jgi:hypothetical protein